MKKMLTGLFTGILTLTQPSCHAFPYELEEKVREEWRETGKWFKYDSTPEIPDFWSSAEETRKNQRGDCDDYTLYSAVKLSEFGFNEKALVFLWYMQIKVRGEPINIPQLHVVHLLEYNGLYGSSGFSEIDRRIPRYSSVEDLVKSYGFNKNKEMYYAVINLSDIPIKSGEDNKFFLVKKRIENANWKKLEK